MTDTTAMVKRARMIGRSSAGRLTITPRRRRSVILREICDDVLTLAVRLAEVERERDEARAEADKLRRALRQIAYLLYDVMSNAEADLRKVKDIAIAAIKPKGQA